MKRMSWIDTAKGITIVLVVIGHVGSSYHSAGLYLTSNLFCFSHDFVYSFHMPMFMLLSGLLFSYSTVNDKKSAIKQKIFNYGIPYVTFSFVWYIFKMILSPNTNTQLSVSDILLIPFYPISFMWYIYALLIMQVMQITIGKKGPVFQSVHLVISLVLMFILPYLIDALQGIRFSDLVICDVFKFWFYFLLGVYYGQQIVSWIEKVDYRVTAGVSIAVLILANMWIYRMPSIETVFVRVIVALIGCVFIIAISHVMSNNKMWNYLGRSSLAIYVLQGLAIAGTRTVLTKVYKGSDFNGIVPFVVCTIMGTVLPLIVFEISKRIGKLDFLFMPGKYIKVKNSRR